MSGFGYIYVLSNEAMPGLYKIGRTDDIRGRMSSLHTTGVPLPFYCEFAMKVENPSDVEDLLHEAFGEHRVNPKREFFKVPVKRIIAALKLTRGEVLKMDSSDVQGINEESPAEYESGVKRKDITTLNMLNIPIGSELAFVKDSSIKCKVVSNRHVEFEGGRFSLSGLAYKLLTEKYNWSKNAAMNGFWFFTYENEVLGERRQRLEGETLDEES